MLTLKQRSFVKKKITIERLSIFTLFWDWIKCHASDGSFILELRLETAVRLIYQFSILIPSYNAHNMVPFWLVPRIKRNLFKANNCSNRLSKGKAPSKLSSSFDSHQLAAKNKPKNMVFKHIQWICVFSVKRHHYLSIVLCDLLIIYERIRHHLHLLRRRTLKQTQYFVFIHI